MKFLRKNLIDITIFILLQYFFTSFILIYLYTGGNAIYHDDQVYAWHLNYLSDLGRAFYFNGNENPFWIFYGLSLGLVGIGTFLYFYLLSALIKNKVIKLLIILFSILSGIGYILIGFYPVDLYFTKHISAGMLGFYSFFFANLLLVMFINREKYRLIYHLTLLLIFLFLGRMLAIFIAHQAGADSLYMLQIKTISQKIVVYGQIITSIMILWSLKKQALYSGR